MYNIELWEKQVVIASKALTKAAKAAAKAARATGGSVPASATSAEAAARGLLRDAKRSTNRDFKITLERSGPKAKKQRYEGAQPRPDPSAQDNEPDEAQDDGDDDCAADEEV